MSIIIALAAAAGAVSPTAAAIPQSPILPVWVSAEDDSSGGGGPDAEGIAATGSDIDISATITLTNDYRFRGVSLSNRDPAIQAGVEASSTKGFYVGAWGSSIANTIGTNMELDIYGGWRGDVAGLTVDANVTSYLYPGGKGGNYSEVIGSVAKTLGPVEAKLGVGYSPDQKNLAGDNLYLFGQAKAGIPGTPLTVTAGAGHEKGSLAGTTGRKWDWSMGVDAVFDAFTIGLKYVDSDINRLVDPGKLAGSGVVVSFGLSF